MQQYKKAQFTIECGPKFDGITDGTLWNGWACPWFTLETMRAIKEWVNDGINDPIEVEGDKVFDVYIDERIECRTITLNGVKYYSIDGWCFDLCEGGE